MKKILTITFLISNLKLIAGGPWTVEKNHGYYQLTGTYIGYDQRYINGNNYLPLLHDVTDITLQGYAEYGVSNSFNLLANIPFKFQNIQPQSSIDSLNTPYYDGSLSGFGNISIAGKYQFLQKKIIGAAQLRFDIETYSQDPSTGLRTGYPSYGISPTISFGSGGNKWFAYGETGVTLRSENYCNQFNLKAEGGYKVSKTYFILVVDVAVLLNAPHEYFLPDPFTYTALYNDQQGYTAFGLKINQELSKNFMINAAVYGAVSGSAVAAAPSLNLGIAFKK
jgi:hypothetical protein